MGGWRGNESYQTHKNAQGVLMGLIAFNYQIFTLSAGATYILSPG
jgi:hypothetical protein